jgi:hypothetical protein
MTQTLKGSFNTPKGMITRMDLAEMLSIKHKTDVKTALKLIKTCEQDDEIDEDSPSNHFELLEEACAILAYDRGEIDAKELKFSIVKAEAQLGTEQSILEAAINTGMHNGYTALAEKYDFANLTQFVPKAGVIPCPEDYAAAIGLGVDMSSKGMWIAGEGIRHLYALGFENVVTQIAASLKLSYSHVSGWHRAAQRVPLKYRSEISPTVAVEIACSKYSDDEATNNKKVIELVEQACKEGWTALEARSHVRMEQGKEPLAKTPKGANSWVGDMGGTDELLILASQWSIGGGAGELDQYHFIGKLVKIFSRLKVETQSTIRLIINDRMKQHHKLEESGQAGLFDEDTMQDLLKIAK